MVLVQNCIVKKIEGEGKSYIYKLRIGVD